MNNMFNGATAFNRDISSWNTAKVTLMNGMFNGAAAFNAVISSWDTSLVTDMSTMFQSATAFNQDISSWVTSAVTDMSNMFNGAAVFNQDISSWVVSAVANFNSMFSGATSFNKDITGWTGAAGASATNMFSGATAWIARHKYTSNPGGSVDGPASAWTAPGPFANLAALQTAVNNCLSSVASGACTCSIAVDCGAAVYEPITNWDTSLVADMNALFQQRDVISTPTLDRGIPSR